MSWARERLDSELEQALDEAPCCLFCTYCDVLRGRCEYEERDLPVNVWDDGCGHGWYCDRSIHHRSDGFSLAELLVVVAIIAVLVGVAMPSFVIQLERSREAVDLANLRSAYSEAVSRRLVGDSLTDSCTVNDVTLSSDGAFEHVDVDELPFSLPEGLSIEKGTYSALFDFTGDKPGVTLTPS